MTISVTVLGLFLPLHLLLFVIYLPAELFCLPMPAFPRTHTFPLFLLYTLILDSPPTPPPPACWLFFFSCLPLSDRYYSSSASSASPPCWPCACICLWCGFVFVMERIIKNEIMFKYANVPSLSLSLFLPSAPSPFISLSPSLYLALSFGA